MSVESDKEKRKVITLDTKLDINKRFNHGKGKHQQSAGPQRVSGTTNSVQI
jgi:hypothetical protein